MPDLKSDIFLKSKIKLEKTDLRYSQMAYSMAAHRVPIWDRLSKLESLPSLPQVLLKLLEACNDENGNLLDIARIAGSDPSLSAKILKLVNSAFFGMPRRIESIEQAVLLVGARQVQNLALCSSVFEAFSGIQGRCFDFDQFWWHSLRCAFLAREIATQTGFGHPEEAFMAGLLHDVGKLVLQVNFTDAYDQLAASCGPPSERHQEEKARLGASHAGVGAWLLDRWNLPSVLGDAIRYHHEPLERITHALPLVRVIYAANRLTQEPPSDPAGNAEAILSLLDLAAADIDDLLEHAGQKACELAEALGIEIGGDQPPPEAQNDPARAGLLNEVRNFSLLVGTLNAFLQVEDRDGILDVMAQGLKILFDVQRPLFFLRDREKALLTAYLPDPRGGFGICHDLTVPEGMQDSALVRALVGGKPAKTFITPDQGPPVIVDEQIMRFLEAKSGICCLPLIAQGETVASWCSGWMSPK